MKVTLSNTIGSATELQTIECDSATELVEILSIIQSSKNAAKENHKDFSMGLVHPEEEKCQE